MSCEDGVSRDDTACRCDWKRISVRDVHGVRQEVFECRRCDAVKSRWGPAPYLGDSHRRMD